jgi:hypothetical protein
MPSLRDSVTITTILVRWLKPPAIYAVLSGLGVRNNILSGG